MRPILLFTCLSLSLAGACADEGVRKPFPVGAACVPAAARADAPISIQVFDTCSGCEETSDFRCDVEVADQTVSVRVTALTIETAELCADVCRTRDASCDLPPLAAGTYELVFVVEGSPAFTTTIEVGAEDAEAVCSGDCCEMGLPCAPPPECN